MPPAIDHVVIGVQDGLDSAVARWRRLGFTMTERGHHTLGSSNHLAIFGRDYLELIGFEPGRDAARPELRAGPLGLAGLVFRPPEGQDAPPGLIERGVPHEVRDFSRPVAAPDGTLRDARFRTVNLAAEAVPYGRVYFCRHFTPELVWQPQWQGHANGVTGVAEFVIAAPDPAATAALYGTLFGADALRQDADGVAVPLAGDAVLRILRWDAAEAAWGEALPAGDRDAPRMVALALRTASLDAARAALRAGDIRFAEREGRIAVAAADASGCALAFVG